MLYEWMVIASLLTVALVFPYVLERIKRHGLVGAAGNPPAGGFEAAPWAVRAKAAHANAIENLVVFLGVAAAAQFAGLGQDGTVVLAAQVYVGARLLHYLVYAAGVPFMRTITFFVGLGATVVIAVSVLS